MLGFGRSSLARVVITKSRFPGNGAGAVRRFLGGGIRSVEPLGDTDLPHMIQVFEALRAHIFRQRGQQLAEVSHSRLEQFHSPNFGGRPALGICRCAAMNLVRRGSVSSPRKSGPTGPFLA
jgi:hypothetical protein